MPVRIDTFEVKPARRTDQGYLVAEGRAARAGVLTYRNPDGSSRRELVPEEELTRTDSLGSIGLKPITDGHPDQGVVDVDNVTVEQKGVSLQKVKYQDGFVDVDILITDPDLAEAVERGDKEELSLGYHLDELDETPGEHPEYGRYDAIQRGRIANHLAVVERGRAGPDVRVRTDSGDSDIAYYREDFCGYWGITDDDLPMRVKELDDDRRQQWLDAYHDAYWDDRLEDEPPSVRSEAAENQADIVVFEDSREDHTMADTEENQEPEAADQDQADDGDRLDGDLEAKVDLALEAIDDLREDAEDEDKPGYEDQLEVIADAMSGVTDAISQHRSKADELQAQVDALMSEFSQDEEDGDMEEHDREDEERNDSADKPEDQAPDGLTRQDMLDWHNERKELETVAEDLRVDGYEEQSNAELRRSIVEEHFGEERTDATDGEIKGEFRAVKAIRRKRADSYNSASETVRKGRQDGVGSKRKSDKAQERYHRRMLNGGVDPEERNDSKIDRLLDALEG